MEVPVLLLVEDNPAHARLVQRCLARQSLPHRIYHLSDGEAVLDFLHQRGSYNQDTPRPHLVLLDLRLPKLDGLEVLNQIKRDDVLQRIPVVILTTSDAPSDIQQAYDARANSYLVKPDDYEAFSKLLQDVSAYWLGRNQPAEEV